MKSKILDKKSQLRELMSEVNSREVECQAYLVHAHILLMPPISKVVQVVREQISTTGRSDYILLCEVNEAETRRRLYIWEAKAPQLAPFEVLTRNRLMPSRALVEAENQLLYYYDEYRSSTHLLDRYEIRHPDDVRLGGIIIGRDDNLVKSKKGIDLDLPTTRQMANSAIRIRQHFYQEKLRLLTWDRILNVIPDKNLATILTMKK